MIAAIANFLNYDIYDLELTAVADNTDMRKLLIETSSKSIIVIEDIDCSLDIASQRKKIGKKKEAKGKKKTMENEEEEDDDKNSKITISGLLNFIDGIWFASGGERIIIFTTYYVEKLDELLSGEEGWMHIELSYCNFEGFKVLAKNYLGLESHDLFGIIQNLLEETNMSRADVAENLMPKTIKGNAETCLENLIQALRTAKEEARNKAEEEERLKVEEGTKK